MKYVYEVKYAMDFQLFTKAGKPENNPEDFTGTEILHVVGDGDTENMIKKAKQVAFKKHVAFADT